MKKLANITNVVAFFLFPVLFFVGVWTVKVKVESVITAYKLKSVQPKVLLSEWIIENPRPHTTIKKEVVVTHFPLITEKGEWKWVEMKTPLTEVPTEYVLDMFDVLMPHIRNDLEQLKQTQRPRFKSTSKVLY